MQIINKRGTEKMIALARKIKQKELLLSKGDIKDDDDWYDDHSTYGR